MIIRTLIKNWKLILDIALVLALILLLLLWNPGNMFGKGLKLQHTANMVAEIKEIGELITAEYYGEVIASDEEAMLHIMDVDSIEWQATTHYIQQLKEPLLKSYLDKSTALYQSAEEKNFWLQNGKERFVNTRLARIKDEIVDSMRQQLENSLSDHSLNALLLFIATYEHGTSINQKKFIRKSENGNGKYTKKVLHSILEVEYDRIVHYAEGDPDYQDYANQGFTTPYRYSDFYFDYMEQSLPRKQQKVEIAIIGRGSVKAGFRFDQLDERNVVYDEEKQMVYLYGFNAQILYQDINPWFIPEQKVPGYQIIMAKNASFEKMKELKVHCVEKLRYQAELAGILSQAQENGEMAMAEFFGLIMDREIKKVVFKSNQLAMETKPIIADSIITNSEIIWIDSLVQRELKAIGEEQGVVQERRKQLLKAFIAEVSQYDIHYKDQRFKYNFFNKHLPAILADTILLQKDTLLDPVLDYWYVDEMALIRQMRHLFSSDTSGFDYPDDYQYWSSDSLAYFAEYDAFIDLLATHGEAYLMTSQSKEKVTQTTSRSILKYAGGLTAGVVIQDTLYRYALSTISKLDTLKFGLPEGVNWQDQWVEQQMDTSLLESMQELGMDTATQMGTYLYHAKLKFDQQDNGFRRLRRSMKESSEQAKAKMNSWAESVRSSWR